MLDREDEAGHIMSAYIISDMPYQNDYLKAIEGLHPYVLCTLLLY